MILLSRLRYWKSSTNLKIGNETKNFEARSVIRFLDKISEDKGLNNWIDMGPNRGRLKIMMNSDALDVDAEDVYGKGKNDHKIINVALSLVDQITKVKSIPWSQRILTCG